MLYENARKFKELLESDEELRAKLQEAAASFTGDREDDRSVFEEVVAPFARSAGIELSYDEVRAAHLESCELTDEELELVAGGAGVLWQRLVTGALVATMVATAIPVRAIAAEPVENGGSPIAEQVQVESASESAPVDYAASFAMGDIATPEGVTVSEQGIQTSEMAPTEALMATQTATQGVQYERSELTYVSDTAKKVTSFGKGFFDIIYGASKGDYGKIFGGAEDLLKLAGVIDSGSSVSNDQILAEVQRLNSLVESMSERLDENTKQTYQNRLVIFDNALGVLAIDSKMAERMFEKGKDLPEVSVLQTSDAQYTQKLVKAMEDAEKAGNKDFKGFTKLMSDIETNFKLVAVECAKSEASSPFHAFDSYWSLYFNFETQGYYLRQAYRSCAEWQLKRTYALLGVYYDITSDPADGGSREALTDALGNALRGIDAMDAGKSPEDVEKGLNGMASFYYNFRVPWNSARVEVGHSSFNRGWVRHESDAISDDNMKEFCRRLHGRTVAEDLRLAGVMVDYSSGWNDYLKAHGSSIRVNPEQYLGLAYRGDGKAEHTVYLPFNATSFTPQSHDSSKDGSKCFLTLSIYNSGFGYGSLSGYRGES